MGLFLLYSKTTAGTKKKNLLNIHELKKGNDKANVHIHL